MKQHGHNIICGKFGESTIQGIECCNDVNQYWPNCHICKGGALNGLF